MVAQNGGGSSVLLTVANSRYSVESGFPESYEVQSLLTGTAQFAGNDSVQKFKVFILLSTIGFAPILHGIYI